ncbi:MAG: hypothetical protein SVR94_06040, partial [Pseudomonadota bacterium]|nr:hypothetical protein [Pseudomonadota bacterium]
MDKASILTTALSDLLADLRLAGYRVGTTQLIAAQDLILALAAQGKLPTDLSALTTLLGPLFCHSPEEQQAFPRHFEDWLTRIETRSKPQTKPTVDEASMPTATETSDSQPSTAQGQLGKWLALMAIAVVIVITAIAIYQPSDTTPNRLFDLMKNRLTDIDYQEIRQYFDFKQDPKEIGLEPLSPKTVQQHSPASSAKPNLIGVVSAILLLLLVALLIWKTRWWFRKQAFLAREELFTPPNLKKLAVKNVETDIFHFALLPQVAQKLRKHIAIPTHKLDVKATLTQTLRLGGWLTPVTSTTKRMPTYLALIHKITFKDHQADFIDALLDQLSAQGVLINRYYFSQDPRRYYSAQLPALTLAELAYHHQEDYLLLFAQEESLIDPVTGTVVSWIEHFSAWSQRYLLTLAPSTGWGPLLEASGFSILPVNETGLIRLAEQIENQTIFSELLSSTKALPQSLYERPHRWLQRHAPDAATLTALLEEIRTFLGAEGYYWFSACAVYPELHWPLTLHLGTQLTTSSPLLTYQRLTQLIRLPWFRHGYMPNWLREHLLAELTIPQEHAIRLQLQAFLQSVTLAEQPATHFYLEVGNKPRSTFRRWLNVFQRRPRSKPAQDQVFVTFMANKLAVALPHALYRLLIQEETQPDPNEKTKLPSVFGLIWSLFMQPITLHHRLQACGITMPNAPLLTLWQAPGADQQVKRQYILRLLAVASLIPMLLLLLETTITWPQFLISLLALELISLGVGIGTSLRAGLLLGLTVSIATSTIIWAIWSLTEGNLALLAHELNGLMLSEIDKMEEAVHFYLFISLLITILITTYIGKINIDIYIFFSMILIFYESYLFTHLNESFYFLVICIFYIVTFIFIETNIFFFFLLRFGAYLSGISLVIMSAYIMSTSGLITLNSSELIIAIMMSGLLIQMMITTFSGVVAGIYTTNHKLIDTTLLFSAIIIGFLFTIAFTDYNDVFAFISAQMFLSLLIYLISRITLFTKTLHTLTYPLEVIWQTLCYLLQQHFHYPTLRFSPVLYHDFSYLPYPFLGPHIA